MKKDYSKIYDKKNNEEKIVKEEPVVIEETPVEEVKEEIKHEEVKEQPEKKEKVTKPFMAEVIGSLNLNVRKKPMGDVFTNIAPGAQVKVLEISEDGEWYQIESPKGFIMKKFTKKVK